MRNKPLAVQIWFVFAGIMVGISILLILIVPYVLKPFFTQENFTRIEDAQTSRWDLLEKQPTQGVPENRPSPRSVRHMVMRGTGSFQPTYQLPSSFIEEVKNQAINQVEVTRQYKKDFSDQTIYYAIHKGEISGEKVYLMSYMGSTYQKSLVQSIVRQIAIMIAIVLLVSWPPSLLLAKYLSRSLVNMEKQVKRIANRDWNEPLVLNRNDEIGRLAGSIEHMRQRLIQQDANQRSLLQNISHELKTPIMVIQSYTQSIQDGIYPKGNLSESVKVIEEESERLKKLVQQLLYITKLDYLATRELANYDTIDVQPIIRASVDRLGWQRPDIDWELTLTGGEVKGEAEQLRVAIENILDNQIRYAVRKIKVSTKEKWSEDRKKFVVICFWNDGPMIETEILHSLFQPFKKGGRGQFGLGLSIVRRIVDLYNGKVWAANEERGVSFYMEFPAD